MPAILFILSGHASMGEGKPAGCYFPELVHPYYVMRHHGIQVDFTTPASGGPSLSRTDFNDPAQIKLLMDREAMDRIMTAPTPESIDPDTYAAVFYTGGHGDMYDFPDDARLIAIAERIWARGGVVSAMCHGPAGLINLKDEHGEYLVKNRRVTCFSRAEEVTYGLLMDIPYVLEDRLQARGARYSCYGVNQGCVVQDGRLVTGQNWHSSQWIAETVAGMMLGK